MKIRSLFAVILLLLSAAACAAGEPEPAQFSFVVMGDSRPSLPDGAQPGVFREMIKRIDAQDPAFVMHTGGSVYGSSSIEKLNRQYADFRDAVKLLRAKLHLTIGNHEIQGRQANQEFWEKELGALYYSFDREGSHFIVLDSHIIGEEGRIAGEQLEWLKEDLRKARGAAHRFVFVHMPLYPVDGHVGNCLDRRRDERDDLHRLFTLNRVDTVFSGHEHLFDEQTRNGVRYVVTGGGGAGLRPSTAGAGDFYHYVTVNVRGEQVEMKGFRPAQRGRPDEEFAIGKTRK